MSKRKPSDAEVCRRNGWGPGTWLWGVCPNRGDLCIRITAVGESAVLARRPGCMEGCSWDLAAWEGLREVRKNEVVAAREPGNGVSAPAAGE